MSETSVATAPISSLQKDYQAYQQGSGQSLLSLYSPDTAASIRRMRDQAHARWLSLPVPSRKQEEWHYTSAKMLLEADWSQPTQTQPTLTIAELDSIPFMSTPCTSRLVFIDGFISKTLSVYSDSSKLEAYPLSELWASEDPKFRQLVSSASQELDARLAVEDEFFTAFNLSYLREGALVQIEENAQIDKPILLVFVSTGRHCEEKLHGRSSLVRIKARPGSKLSVFEAHVSLTGSRSALNTLTDIRVERGAHLTYTRLQNNGLNDAHKGETRISVGEKARVESHEITLGAALARQNLTVELRELEASAMVNGLYLVAGKQHVDHHTSIDHQVPNTESQQLYKGILNDEAHAVFNGRIEIRLDAQKSNASQLNQNLVLSQKAEIDTKPELDIHADDVKAAHGATVGQMDPEHLFYLESRAIDRATAMHMLSIGFAQDVVDRIGDETVRNEVRGVVSAKLASGLIV